MGSSCTSTTRRPWREQRRRTIGPPCPPPASARAPALLASPVRCLFVVPSGPSVIMISVESRPSEEITFKISRECDPPSLNPCSFESLILQSLNPTTRDTRTAASTPTRTAARRAWSAPSSPRPGREARRSRRTPRCPMWRTNNEHLWPSKLAFQSIRLKSRNVSLKFNSILVLFHHQNMNHKYIYTIKYNTILSFLRTQGFL